MIKSTIKRAEAAFRFVKAIKYTRNNKENVILFKSLMVVNAIKDTILKQNNVKMLVKMGFNG
jgi:hypothetical protein